MAEWKFGLALRQNENKKIFQILSTRFENLSVFSPLKSQRGTHSKAVLVDSLMTIDTKSPDQSVAQQLTTTTSHDCSFTYSRGEIFDCTNSRSRCEISYDVIVLAFFLKRHDYKFQKHTQKNTFCYSFLANKHHKLRDWKSH